MYLIKKREFNYFSLVMVVGVSQTSEKYFIGFRRVLKVSERSLANLVAFKGAYFGSSMVMSPWGRSIKIK